MKKPIAPTEPVNKFVFETYELELGWEPIHVSDIVRLALDTINKRYSKYPNFFLHGEWVLDTIYLDCRDYDDYYVSVILKGGSYGYDNHRYEHEMKKYNQAMKKYQEKLDKFNNQPSSVPHPS